MPAVLITCDPLAGDGALAIHAEGGSIVAWLWRQHLEWRCSDGLVQVLVLAEQVIPLPASEPSEPVAGALARIVRAVGQGGGLVLLLNPAMALGPERIALAAGVRWFALASDADAACWDAALALGMPVFGIRGTVVATAIRPDAVAMLSALTYGNVRCEEGLRLRRCDESPQGVDIEGDEDLEAAVLVRGGFEAARLHGRRLSWRDQGNEGTVRLVVSGASGTCWTQPRFVAARAVTGSPHGSC